MLAQMLNLDGRVVGESREFPMHRLYDSHGVGGPVEEIRISKRDVPGSRLHLLSNILEHDFWLHDSERALIDRHHRTMAAQMLASAARLGIAGALGCPVQTQLGVMIQDGKHGTPRRLKLKAIERDERLSLEARSGRCQPVRQRNQRRLELASDHGADAQLS